MTVRFKIALTIFITGLITAIGVISTVAYAFQGNATDEGFRSSLFDQIVEQTGSLASICIPAAGITRDDLALLLNHTNRGIQIWFQNQRNSRDAKDSDALARVDKSKRGTVDILTLIDIIENNLPGDKRRFWERFINHVPRYY